MTARPLAAVLRSIGLGTGLAVAAIGAVVLVGWVFDVGLLKSVLPGFSTTKANTATGLSLAGIALALLARSAVGPRGRLVARILAQHRDHIQQFTVGPRPFWILHKRHQRAIVIQQQH